MNLRRIIEEVIEAYNHYRSPEAIAKLTTFTNDQFTVFFKGPFCQSCGVYDYFEDLIYEVKNLASLSIEITKIKEEKEGFTVTYKLSSI
ncbi:hypothetical protein KEJ50_02925 [Candidatus Bathyarchaeota archaeon]|nr:hypothetical protein [Candidatus Bathyarchaeota archaeon]